MPPPFNFLYKGYFWLVFRPDKIVLSKEESSAFWQRRDYKGFSPNVTADTAKWDKAAAIEELPVISAICVPSKDQSVQLCPDNTILVTGELTDFSGFEAHVVFASRWIDLQLLVISWVSTGFNCLRLRVVRRGSTHRQSRHNSWWRREMGRGWARWAEQRSSSAPLGMDALGGQSPRRSHLQKSEFLTALIVIIVLPTLCKILNSWLRTTGWALGEGRRLVVQRPTWVIQEHLEHPRRSQQRLSPSNGYNYSLNRKCRSHNFQVCD